MKRYSLISLVIIAMLAIAGCGNKDNGNDDVTNDNSANASANDSENNSADNADSIEYGDEQVLQLGETGTIKDTTGDYEVTPMSFVVTEEWENQTPKIDGDVFLIIDVSIKNIGESVLNGEQLRKVDAIGGDETTVDNSALFDYVDQLEGELQPGEIMEGQFAFALPPTDTYHLAWALHLGTVSNQITWELPADQAN